MDIVGGLAAHPPQIQTLQDTELLKKDWTLRPWLAFVNSDTMVSDIDGIFESRRKSRKIVLLQQSTIRFGPAYDFARNVAAVKAVTSCVDRRIAATVAGSRLSIQ